MNEKEKTFFKTSDTEHEKSIMVDVRHKTFIEVKSHIIFKISLFLI